MEGLNLHITAKIVTMTSTTSVTFSNSHRTPDEVITTFCLFSLYIHTLISILNREVLSTMYFGATYGTWGL